MGVKLSISLTDQQYEFARSLVESGQYSSLSAVVQQGFELLRQKTEVETTHTEVLRALPHRRLAGSVISTAEMASRVDAMIERKRRSI